MPTRRPPNLLDLASFTEQPLLRAIKGGRIGIGVKGLEPKDLTKALANLSEKLTKTKDASEYNRLKTLHKLLTDLQQAEGVIRQLPPTERGLASVAQAAALKREKRVVEDPKNPSRHFAREMGEDDLSPEDYEPVRGRKVAFAKEMEKDQRTRTGRRIQDIPTPKPMKQLGMLETAALREGARKMFGPRMRGMPRRLTGGATKEGGPVIRARNLIEGGMKSKEVASQRSTPVEKPEEYRARRMAQDRLYRESLAGGLEQSSAIEDLQPERFGELRQEAAKIVEKAGDRPAKATAKSVRQYNVTVQKAVKAGEISKDLGNTLRNRLIESIMTSGSGDAVLGALSSLGGKTRYQTKRGLVRTIPPDASSSA